jgi:hypothetical protein
MNVFGKTYLEPIQEEQNVDINNWSWTPENPDVKKIYASGNKTATRSSTYAAEKDNEGDSDRPNEGV